MKIITRELPKRHNIYLAGDFHLGTIACHIHGIKQLIASVAEDKDGYLSIMGDLAEAITIDDKRFNRGTEDPKIPVPLLQYQEVVKLFRPIRHKTLLCLQGNHDWAIENRFGNFVRDYVCKELEVEYGTPSCKLVIKDTRGNLQYKMFLAHSPGGSITSNADDPLRRDANMKLSLKRKLHDKAGDTLAMCAGHSHKLLVFPPTKKLYLIDDGRNVKQRYTETNPRYEYIDENLRWYVNTGSFHKLYVMGEGTYSEKIGYPPTELGFVKVIGDGGTIQSIEPIIVG